MNEITRILSAIAQGDPSAASQLLPLVYDELRQLAAHKLSLETPGQTLQPTALVHEAYLRLVGETEELHWDNRGHCFAAAAEAMRRILVENARRKHSQKHGGGRRCVPLEEFPRSSGRLLRESVVSRERPGCEPSHNATSTEVVQQRWPNLVPNGAWWHVVSHSTVLLGKPTACQLSGDPLCGSLRLEQHWLRGHRTNYTAGSVSDLIHDINAANQTGGTNTISPTTNYSFDLRAVNNSTNGANGLSVIFGGGKKEAADNQLRGRRRSGPNCPAVTSAPGASSTRKTPTDPYPG